MCWSWPSGAGLNALLGRTLELFSAERKPNGYAWTRRGCRAEEQQSESWKALKIEAGGQ